MMCVRLKSLSTLNSLWQILEWIIECVDWDQKRIFEKPLKENNVFTFWEERKRKSIQFNQPTRKLKSAEWKKNREVPHMWNFMNFAFRIAAASVELQHSFFHFHSSIVHVVDDEKIAQSRHVLNKNITQIEMSILELKFSTTTCECQFTHRIENLNWCFCAHAGCSINSILPANVSKLEVHFTQCEQQQCCATQRAAIVAAQFWTCHKKKVEHFTKSCNSILPFVQQKNWLLLPTVIVQQTNIVVSNP